MKLSSGVIFAGIIVLLFAVFEYWQYRDEQRYRAELAQQLSALNARLETVHNSLQKAREREEQNSLGGIIENANKALIQGWSAMVESVERELERAQENIAQSRRESAQKPQQPPADDNGAAPAGTSGEGPL